MFQSTWLFSKKKARFGKISFMKIKCVHKFGIVVQSEVTVFLREYSSYHLVTLVLCSTLPCDCVLTQSSCDEDEEVRIYEECQVLQVARTGII